MTLNKPSDFIAWLDKELEARGWSDHQLSRRAGLSHSVISKARSGTAPKWEACEALAGALQMPAEQVFRAAGLLPIETEDGIFFEEWRHILPLLTERDRYELLRIARLKLELLERDGQERSRRPGRPGEHNQSSEL